MNTNFNEKKVLVTDNSLITTKIIKNYLIESGFEESHIFMAREKHQAMLMFGLEKFDLVTTGFHLKDGNGIELLKEIRKCSDDTKNNTSFLLISSENPEVFQSELVEQKGNGYLTKPFNQEKLQETIISIFNNKNEDVLENAPAPAPGNNPNPAAGDSPLVVPHGIIDAFIESTITAMDQFGTEVTPGNPNNQSELNGYFSSCLDIIDSENRILLTLDVNFPKKAACNIYQGVFGGIDMEQVCDVVQELTNMIGGMVKPKIFKFSKDIMELVYPNNKTLDKNFTLNLEIGIPEAKMGEGHSLNLDIKDPNKFYVPFGIEDETFYLLVIFQSF